MTKTFTIALFACALSGTAISAQQKEQPKDKSGAFSQPAEPQPVIMPAGQRPDEWKFGKEKEAEAKKAVEDKKLAKKKAEEEKKAAAEAKKKTEAERKLAAKAAREETEKKRVEERRAADEQKKATEQQRAADARAEREAAAAKKAEEQKAADEKRALERREAAERAAEERRAEAEKAAAEVREKEAREKEAREAARKANGQKAASRKSEQKSAAQPAPRPASQGGNPTLTSVATKTSPVASGSSSGTRKQSDSQAAGAAPAAAPAAQKPAAGGDAAAAGDASPAGGATANADADGKPVVDPMRPPVITRADEQPDAWKMQREKPQAEGAAGQAQSPRSADSKSSDAKSASVSTGQSKPSASAPPKPKQPWRGWSDRALISLNAGYQAASFDLRDSRSFDPPVPGDREQRTLNADYSVESGMSFDFGGGYRVWRALAAGVSVTRFKDSRDVPVSGSIPHPFFFNRARAITGATSGARQEMAVHVDAMWVVPIRPKMTLAVFGGPSFYSVKQTVVSDYDYNQSYPYDDVTLTRVISGDESSSVTGVNFGADVGYYFTDTIGVGGLIRFGRASVDTSIGSLDVGGPEFGVGLRIRIPPARPRGRAVATQPPPTTR